MRAICLHESGLSLVCVDGTFYPDGTRIGALTFSDNIAALSHSWDFISQPSASQVCVAPSHDAPRLSQHLLLARCAVCVCVRLS